MRKLIVSEFMTLDGVMQAPGGPFGDVMNAPRKYVVSKTLGVVGLDYAHA